MIKITADFQSSQNYLMAFLLLDIADLFFQSSYRTLCLTVKNHVVEKTGQDQYYHLAYYICIIENARKYKFVFLTPPKLQYSKFSI
jgi:hypothetical protein